MQIIKSFVAALLALSLLATSGNACARFVSVDPVQTNTDNGENFNRYYYGNNNPYKFTDPDGRLPVLIPIVAGAVLLFTSGDANSPAPGEPTTSMSPGDAVGRFAEAIPAGKLGVTVKFGVDAGGLTQRAAHREAKRQAGIPTSQQPISQTNGQARYGEPVGRQQTFVVPAEGGGNELKSVQVARDTRGKHAGMPQIEAGPLKPGADPAPGGRPKLENTNKVRVDFVPE